MKEKSTNLHLVEKIKRSKAISLRDPVKETDVRVFYTSLQKFKHTNTEDRNFLLFS